MKKKRIQILIECIGKDKKWRVINTKKILLFCFLILSIIQEAKAIVPAIAVNNMKEQREILNKKRNTIYNNGFVILNKEEKIQKLLNNKKIPKFYLNYIHSYKSIKDMIIDIRKTYEDKVEILYIEVIPMYDRVNVFIIYNLEEKQKEKIKQLEWYE